MNPDAYIPYCGMPPGPNDWLTRWTLEPGLLIGLAVALALILWQSNGAARKHGLGGWALVAVLFVSPLCALSMALFSARVGQHLLLTLVAAPLLARMWRSYIPPTPIAALNFAALFWIWHAPEPYSWTLESDLAYWSMHLSLLASAVALWAGLQHRTATQPFETVLVLAGTASQMTMLAILLIFAPSPWHRWHEVAALSWGMSGSSDQALAGALMWVAGGVLMSATVLLLARGFLRESARS